MGTPTSVSLNLIRRRPSAPTEAKRSEDPTVPRFSPSYASTTVMKWEVFPQPAEPPSISEEGSFAVSEALAHLKRKSET